MKYALSIQDANTKVYEGFESLKLWINDTNTDKQNGKKILFIDEANMQDAKQLSPLLGIYGNPKGISIDGEFHPLTEQHKIVFAGNPKDYQFRHLPY